VDKAILPDLSAFRWKTLKGDSRFVRELTGTDYPVASIDISPDGRWLAIEWAVGYKFQSVLTIAAIIDTQGDQHRWITTEHFGYEGLNWLPDGRLLWVDEEGAVLLGNGQSTRTLHSPEPMSSIRYLTDDIAFANSTDNLALWRVQPASDQWEKIEGISGSTDFGVARDGSYILAFRPPDVWRIPTRLATPPTLLPNLQVDILGRDSGSLWPTQLPWPIQLANSPYWFNALTVQNENKTAEVEGFIVNPDNGKVLTPTDLQLSEKYQVTGYEPSSDGKWLVVWLKDSLSQNQMSIYVTPSDQLTAGKIIDNVRVAGWHDSPPILVINNEENNTLSLAHLPLTDDTEIVPLDHAGKFLADLSDSLLATDSTEAARILQFDFDGNLLSTVDLSKEYDLFTVVAGAQNRVYLGASKGQVNTDGTCSTKHTLIELEMKP